MKHKIFQVRYQQILPKMFTNVYFVVKRLIILKRNIYTPQSFVKSNSTSHILISHIFN